MTRKRSRVASAPQMANRIARRAVQAALALVAGAWLLGLGGCAGPGYYAQAITGHLRLMNARVDTAEFLAEAGSDSAIAEAVREAEAILAFGRRELDLPESNSYRQVVITGRDAVTWNVVAAAEFSVEPKRWCFPVAGCVPYRGYYERERAEAFAATRAARGEDVLVSPATAYSTLGWFDDPLLDTMFRHGEADLAAVLFHELAHEKLYVPGDTAFNEAYASFVAAAGLRRWAAATGRERLAEAWEDRREAAREFSALLAATRESLAGLYASDIGEAAMRERKHDRFEAMRAEYRRLVEVEWGGTDWFGGWMSGDLHGQLNGELNNAHLALMSQYQGGECAFEALFHEAEGDFARFHALAGEVAEMPEKARHAWLETPCGAFASAPDL